MLLLADVDGVAGVVVVVDVGIGLKYWKLPPWVLCL